MFEALDEDCLPLETIDAAKNFVAYCRKVRSWQREARGAVPEAHGADPGRGGPDLGRRASGIGREMSLIHRPRAAGLRMQLRLRNFFRVQPFSVQARS